MNTTHQLPLPPSGDARLLLHSHLNNCRARSGVMHRLQCVTDAVYEAIAPRLVTTAAVLLAVALVINEIV